MHFPAEKCTFLQKNAVFGGHMARNRRKLQEGFRAQESRTLANFHKMISEFIYLQNYESESESVIRGEVSMWTWMRKIICPLNIIRI